MSNDMHLKGSNVSILVVYNVTLLLVNLVNPSKPGSSESSCASFFEDTKSDTAYCWKGHLL